MNLSFPFSWISKGKIYHSVKEEYNDREINHDINLRHRQHQPKNEDDESNGAESNYSNDFISLDQSNYKSPDSSNSVDG